MVVLNGFIGIGFYDWQGLPRTRVSVQSICVLVGAAQWSVALILGNNGVGSIKMLRHAC